MFKSAISAGFLAASLGLAVCGSAQATDLSHEMHTLKSSYKTFSQANNAEQALAALNQMQQAAQASKQATPEGVDPQRCGTSGGLSKPIEPIERHHQRRQRFGQSQQIGRSPSLGQKNAQHSRCRARPISLNPHCTVFTGRFKRLFLCFNLCGWRKYSGKHSI